MQNSKSTKTTKTLQKIPVLYTNANQLSTLKKIELQKIIENKKPLVIAINEIKPKNGSQRTDADYALHAALYKLAFNPWSRYWNPHSFVNRSQCYSNY